MARPPRHRAHRSRLPCRSCMLRPYRCLLSCCARPAQSPNRSVSIANSHENLRYWKQRLLFHLRSPCPANPDSTLCRARMLPPGLDPVRRLRSCILLRRSLRQPRCLRQLSWNDEMQTPCQSTLEGVRRLSGLGGVSRIQESPCRRYGFPLKFLPSFCRPAEPARVALLRLRRSRRAAARGPETTRQVHLAHAGRPCRTP